MNTNRTERRRHQRRRGAGGARVHAVPELAPESWTWLARLAGAIPPLSEWPAPVLLWLARDDEPRTTGVLVAAYLHTCPEGQALEEDVIAAVQNAGVSVLLELARRLGLVADVRYPGGLFNEWCAVKPATGAAILEAITRHHLQLSGQRVPDGLFERICAVVREAAGGDG